MEVLDFAILVLIKIIVGIWFGIITLLVGFIAFKVMWFLKLNRG